MPVIGPNFNFAESVSLRSWRSNQAAVNQSVERLSTGKQLNRASDNPSGSIVATDLQGEQKSVLARLQQIELDSGRYGAIDGALGAVGDILRNLKNYITAAANTGGLSDAEKAAYQADADSIVNSLNFLATSERYNGELILSGYIGAGATNANGNIAGSLASLQAGGTHNLINGDLQGAQQIVDGLIGSISGSQAAVGALQRGLDSETRELSTRNENLSAAISQIVDTNYASEVSSLVRSQALADAARFAMQAARNLQAQTVLALLKSDPPTRTESRRLLEA